ncbi:solute carrier family 25 member 45 isoform X4 [Acinonyx jubatus]|uniref:Solute carrier family 25 member 45 isoform X4 n=1 Tax=Acinonyx jubatus TaxID=32536 RepID=A0ABM3NHL4_ACIJB|nr:solute carrier family 25 member 45 isoform X4 [Acinonyx jubatus]
MPVEEFVAGWISGETLFSLLSHPLHPRGGSLPGDLGGAETKVLVAQKHHPEPAIPEPPGSCPRGAERKPSCPRLQGQGALGLVLGHPFDTVKVRLQTQTTYRGIIDCMVKTYRHESLLGFFKGMSFPIASIAMVNSVLFGVYSNTLLALTATSHQERRAQPPSYIHVFTAGCTGGFVQHLSIQLLIDGVEEDAASRHQGESQLIAGREHRGGGTLAWLPSTPQPGAFRHPLFDIALTLLTYFMGQRARTKDRTRRLAQVN